MLRPALADLVEDGMTLVVAAFDHNGTAENLIRRNCATLQAPNAPLLRADHRGTCRSSAWQLLRSILTRLFVLDANR
jgi:hypothetical protein